MCLEAGSHYPILLLDSHLFVFQKDKRFVSYDLKQAIAGKESPQAKELADLSGFFDEEVYDPGLLILMATSNNIVVLRDQKHVLQTFSLQDQSVQLQQELKWGPDLWDADFADGYLDLLTSEFVLCDGLCENLEFSRWDTFESQIKKAPKATV